MAEHSIWGSSTPTGSFTVETDGTPNIRLGETFYQYGTGVPSGTTITGGRVWTPVGVPANVRIMLFAAPTTTTGVTTTTYNLDTTPVRTVDVATNPGGWTEGRWTGYPIPNVGYRWMVAYEFITGSPADDHYVFSATSATRPKVALDGEKIAQAEVDPSNTGGFGAVWSSYFRIGSGAATATGGAGTITYGIDTLVETPGVGNVAPTANAGADQTVTIGTLVTLNGGSSSDSDGTIVAYNWTQVSGTTVSLSGAGATRSFTPTTAGVRVFGLTVTDDDGATSTQDTITVTVNTTGGGNTPPVANAGANQSVDTNNTVTLSGAGSFDPDGTIASYNWVQVGGASVTLSGTGATRTFTPTADGTYIFGLTVIDNNGASSSQDQITVTATTSTGITVAQENANPGMGREYWMDGVGSTAMPAFPRSTYYLPGQIAQFSVNYNLPFTVDIFRLGNYGGTGARRLVQTLPGTPTSQPTPAVISGSNGAVTCAAWSVNATWTVPLNAVAGWYVALLRGGNGVDFGHCLFTVSDKNNKRPVVIVASDSTWHAAYNGFGGNNVYGANTAIGSAADRALCSTYDKPVITQDNVPQTHFYNNTYPYLKWSESMGINAGVTTIEQIKNDPTILDGRSLIVWTGHNEYIPQTVMDKTKDLLTDGQHMVNIAGNDFFWRVKFTDGAFGSATTGRNMWCKKDSLAGPTAIRTGGAGTPFTTEADWTGTWQDTRWSLREPSEEFFGDQFIANGIRADSVTVPSAMKVLPPWRNCPGIQALGIGQSYVFAAGTLGMEWDEPYPSTALEYMTFAEKDILLTGQAADENGAIYDVTATGNHRFMVAVSGNSYVVNFNSDQWGWALDALHLRGSAPADVNAQQMMLNVLYDLGVQANGTNVTSAGLVIPTPVTDFGAAYGLTSIEPPDPPVPGGAHITVSDTSTLNLTITGNGSEATPYVLSGVASPELGYSQSTRMFYSDGVEWHEL